MQFHRYQPSQHSFRGSTQPLDPTRCEVEVWSNDRAAMHWQCRRPRSGETREGLEVCAQHAASYDRAAAKEQAWRDKQDRSEQAKRRAQEIATKLKQVYDLETEVHYLVRWSGNAMGRYDGRLIVDAEALLRLLEELRDG